MQRLTDIFEHRGGTKPDPIDRMLIRNIGQLGFQQRRVHPGSVFARAVLGVWLGGCGVTKLGHQPSICERLHGPKVRQVDDDGDLGLSLAEVGDNAIAAGVGVFHNACVAVDGDRVGSHDPNTRDAV